MIPGESTKPASQSKSLHVFLSFFINITDSIPTIGLTHAISMFNLATFAAKLTHDQNLPVDRSIAMPSNENYMSSKKRCGTKPGPQVIVKYMDN